MHGYWREKEVWIPRELSRLTRHFLNEEGVSRAWLLAREGSMDPKRALKTHTALFKTRRAYHVHGYWREKEVWIPRELSRLTRHFLNEEGVSRAWLLAREGSMDPKRALKTHTALFKRGGRITCMVTGERRKYGSQESSQDSHGTF